MWAAGPPLGAAAQPIAASCLVSGYRGLFQAQPFGHAPQVRPVQPQLPPQKIYMSSNNARADSLSLLLFTLRSGKLLAFNLLKVSEIIPCPPSTPSHSPTT